mmetsp:Transcript_55798/g.129960  ORF Transcript_55798/g.129960 Transcript_55798/m.129960 type:complete len:626 (-) Transcript_55798:155-2032(-)
MADRAFEVAWPAATPHAPTPPPQQLADPVRVATGSMVALVSYFAESLDCRAPREREEEEPLPEEAPGAELLCGIWVYAGSYEYSLGLAGSSEELLFQEPPGVEGATHGTLQRNGRWFEGATVDTSRGQKGRVRLRYEPRSDTIISNVQVGADNRWGEDIVSQRRLHRLVQAVQDKQEEVAKESGFPQPQACDGGQTWPQHWGLTRGQCRELLTRLRAEPGWSPTVSVSELVAGYLAPWTRGTGMGYALLQNRKAPKEPNVLVSHSWSANAEELLEAVLCSTGRHDVLFIAALSLQHGEVDHECASERVLQHISLQCGPCRSYLSALSIVAALAALLLYFGPAVFWGCIPSVGHCATRRVLNEEGLLRAVWAWSEAYAHWHRASWLCSLLDWAPAGCLLLAVFFWLARGRGGCLLLACCEVCPRELERAWTLGVPVRLARGTRSSGEAARLLSRQGRCELLPRLAAVLALAAADKALSGCVSGFAGTIVGALVASAALAAAAPRSPTLAAAALLVSGGAVTAAAPCVVLCAGVCAGFTGALAQALLAAGGYTLLLLLLPCRWLLLLAAALAMVPTLWQEPELPAAALTLPAAVFYVTLALARGAGPVWVLWSCARPWGGWGCCLTQ